MSSSTSSHISSTSLPKYPSCLSFCGIGIQNRPILYYMAFLIWFIGSWACADSTSTLYTAASINGGTIITLSLSLSIGILIGIFAAYFWFIPLAMNNIDRIYKLEEPRLYEFLRPRFIIGIICLDGTTVLLTYFLAKNLPSQLILCSINCTVCVALSLSCFVYVYRIKETCSSNTSSTNSSSSTLNLSLLNDVSVAENGAGRL